MNPHPHCCSQRARSVREWVSALGRELGQASRRYFLQPFYNPWHHRNEIDASKVLMFHAKDDPNVPYQRTREFAEITGTKLKSLNRGGHITTDYVVRRYWVQIKKFFESA